LQDWVLAGLFLSDFAFAQVDLFLPAGGAVELLIVFAEIKTAVVQTLVEVFACYFFADLLEL
jgi:hypothetical protein